ncbi:MAG: hypothetical protein AAGM22_08030 [Acidobacteriota bacterium]
MLRHIVKVLILLLPAAPADCQFLPGSGLPGFDRFVQDFVVFDDGDGAALYATGTFTIAGNTEARHIAKWDGREWSPLGLGLGREVSGTTFNGRALAVHDDGSGPALYVSGRFNLADGVMTRNVARWDGEQFTPLGDGLPDSVIELEVYDDGDGEKLYASSGGLFVWDGASWTDLPAGHGGQDLAVYDDGGGAKLYATTLMSNHPEGGVAAWDGTTWLALAGPSGFGTDGAIFDMAVFDDGGGEKLYVGGRFTTAGGVAALQLASWDGTQWQAVPGSPSTDGGVDALAVFDEGEGPRLAVAFTDFDSREAKVFTWDGATWTELAVPSAFRGSASISTMIAFDAGGGERLHVGGQIDEVGRLRSVRHIATWRGAWTALENPPPNGLGRRAHAFEVFDDGNGEALYAGGIFDSAGDRLANRIARYGASSGRWSPVRDASNLGPVTSSDSIGALPAIEALRTFDDGNGARLYATGDFLRTEAPRLENIGAWDGTAWHPLGTGLSGVGKTLAVFDDGTGPALYVGGSFGDADGVTVNHIARWDGVAFTALDGAAGLGVAAAEDPEVSSSVVFDEGSGPALYIAGHFDEAGGVAVNNLAKWTPVGGFSAVGGFDASASVVDTILDLEVFDEGSGPALFIAGEFQDVNGLEVNGVVRWDGTTFAALAGPSGVGVAEGSGRGQIRDLLAYDAGDGTKLFAGGFFDLAGGEAAYGAATWDGQRWSPLIYQRPLVLNASFPRSPTPGQKGGFPLPPIGIRTLGGFTENGEPTLVASGSFSEMGGLVSIYFARYRDVPGIFADGFETGDTSGWALSVP